MLLLLFLFIAASVVLFDYFQSAQARAEQLDREVASLEERCDELQAFKDNEERMFDLLWDRAEREARRAESRGLGGVRRGE